MVPAEPRDGYRRERRPPFVRWRLVGPQRTLAVMDATPVEEPPAERTEGRGFLRDGWGLYTHVAAVLGAFSLAAFLGNFADTEWRGPIAVI